MSSETSLAPYLASFRRRLRLRDGWLLAQRSLWLAMAVAIGILGIGRLVPIWNVHSWAFAPLIFWLCAVSGYSLLRPRALKKIAQEVDLELGLKERFSTAIELEAQSQTNLPIYQSIHYPAISDPTPLPQRNPSNRVKPFLYCGCANPCCLQRDC